MKRKTFLASVLLLSLVGVVYAGGGFKKIRELLIGFEEVPAVSTVAEGEFRATISQDETQIQYELKYADLEGSVQQAHIHLGQKGVNGGISVFLCTNLGNGPAGTQPCPPSPATITGTITAADVSPNIPATAAARAQGLDTGEFGELLRAVRAGATYVNVHSTKFPGGEIRSQINPNQGNHNGHK
ncbi:MAG TPA: CHRD domain-containing protein [Pyrinomonadaceae bacterium]|nr:CHRD domain-containing protein [Pyrinomonadaceae bacterium]